MVFPGGETACVVIRLPANWRSIAVALPEDSVAIRGRPRNARRLTSTRFRNYGRNSGASPEPAAGNDENVRGLTADDLYLGFG